MKKRHQQPIKFHSSSGVMICCCKHPDGTSCLHGVMVSVDDELRNITLEKTERHGHCGLQDEFTVCEAPPPETLRSSCTFSTDRWWRS